MRRASSVFLSLLSALVLVGCDGSATSATGSGGGASSSASTGSGSECASPVDCPGTDGDCRARSCVDGFCGFSNVPNGTITLGQIIGDCRKLVCDGQGGIAPMADPGDAPDDGETCTKDACSGLDPTHVAVGEGKPCTENGGAVCDEGGHCVACNVSADCTSGVCSRHFCVPPACTDLVKNGGETDVDCGGPECAPCKAGKTCAMASDCVDGVCDATCQTPSCTDLVKNGGETDLDCGGSCPDCPTGKHCLSGMDCQSSVCGGAPLACVAPSCTDAVLNGMESDVDCGAVCASKCALGKKCTANADCLGGACNAVLKTCDPSCTDTVKDNAETDVDCGGPCPDCALGKSCTVDADCLSGDCESGICVDANGCTPQNSSDLTGQSAVSIAFGDALGNAFSPRCIKVSVGTKVTFNGAFASHPLQAGHVVGNTVVPSTAGTSPFPIAPSSESNGTSATYTMTAAGAFPFYCVPHATGGMNGAVLVQ